MLKSWLGITEKIQWLPLHRESNDKGTDIAKRNRQTEQWILYFILAILGVQFLVFMAWSIVLYHRFALTYDFATYFQGVWNIWHGHLNPFSTVLGFPLWGNGGQSLFWFIALLTRIYPHGISILILQDIAVETTEIVTLLFVIDLISAAKTNEISDKNRIMLLLLTGILIVFNPWTYWAVSFDVHTEPFAAAFIILAARETFHRRWKWTALWVMATLTGGLVECTYVVALGITLIIVGKGRQRAGFILVLAGTICFILLDHFLGANKLPPPGIVYGYLVDPGSAGSKLGFGSLIIGMLVHPFHVLIAIWNERLNIWADLSAGGIIGIFSPWGLAIPIVIGASNILSRAFASVSFQNFPLYGFVVIGTIDVLIKFMKNYGGRFKAYVTSIVVFLIAANSMGWFITWAPKTPSHWLTVSPKAADTLLKALKMIPNDSEVIASQGIAGRFAARPWLYTILVNDNSSFPIHSHKLFFVVSPLQGIETVKETDQLSIIANLVRNNHAKLVMHGGGVWVLSWVVPRGQHFITLDSSSNTIPAWVLSTTNGTPVLVGRSSTWHIASMDGTGYVLDHDYWRIENGHYDVSVTLASSRAVNLEIWDTTRDILLARRALTATNSVRTVNVPFDINQLGMPHTYHGWGPFQIEPILPRPGDRVEVRIWQPNNAITNVYTVKLIKKRL
ncbi:hypothetical protein BXT84_09990 [Sulfobacillus thermotolerans]|uniref:DUF2079 domain-containing protein n=1 Tax=Sulfobacillus thermotolerans TaxID=338644 RepID=A0ABN5H2C5_9FIRM|nr:hypothetical protein BXT84_09990 [Sulfobacillus thermotolerans]